MPMTINQICDEILKACLARLPQASPYFSLKQLCITKGASPDEADAALISMLNKFIVKSGKTYVLTPSGEEFAKTGGFAGQIQRKAKEEAIKRDERERARQVSQSVLETNDSVQRTHAFQRTTTWLTLAVAVAAVLVSIIGLFVPRGSTQIESIAQRQLQMQREIDSLRVLLQQKSSSDSLRSTHRK
jgi:hypothetical protein